MNDFLDLLEAVKLDEATPTRLFGNEGVNLSQQGGPRSRWNSPRYREGFARFFETYQGALAGSRRDHRIVREATSTSDFPYLFGDTLDRMLLASYRRHAAEWQAYVHTDQVMDFRAAKRLRVSIGRSILPQVGQWEGYKDDQQDEAKYEITAKKYGGRRAISFESMINDDLGAMKRTPEDLGTQAANTEEYVVTSTFGYDNAHGASGLYHTAHAVGTDTYCNSWEMPFSADALSYVAGMMGLFPGDGGMPIDNDVYHIVVGTERMRQRVEAVLNSLVVQYTGSADRDNLPTANIVDARMRGRIQVHLNKWLKLFDANYLTSWYLFSDPASGWAVETSFLNGYREPQLFMKVSDQVQLGSGSTTPMDGSFEDDSVGYKVRHVIANASTEDAGGWRFTAYSYDNGAAVPD